MVCKQRKGITLCDVRPYFFFQLLSTSKLKALTHKNIFPLIFSYFPQAKAITEKSIYPFIIQEVRPTLEELGISTPEELGLDIPDPVKQKIGKCYCNLQNRPRDSPSKIQSERQPGTLLKKVASKRIFFLIEGLWFKINGEYGHGHLAPKIQTVALKKVFYRGIFFSFKRSP